MDSQTTQSVVGRTLLILGAQAQQLPAIVAAKRMGLRVIVIDPGENPVGFAQADEAYPFDLSDHKNCLAVARDNAVHGVMTLAADYPLPMVAAISHSLGLPGVTPESAVLATNKQKMREALAAADVPSAACYPARTLEEAITACDVIGTSVIFKPALSSGGRGTTHLQPRPDRAELQRAFEHARQFSRNDLVLVEEYLEGPEFSVEAIVFDGNLHVVAITDKVTSGSPHFVELGHSQPTSSDPERQRAIIDVVDQGIRALGIDWSATHSEVRVGPDGPRIIEIAARLGGGCIASHLTPLSTGFDLVEATLLLALGVPSSPSNLNSDGSAIRFLTARPGTITSLKGATAATKLKGVKEISIYAEIGDEVRPLVDASARLGYAIGVAGDAGDALRITQQAIETIEIETSA